MIEVKYIGVQDRWCEIGVTGNQSIWHRGQVEERPDAEATALLETGFFESEPLIIYQSRIPVSVSASKNLTRKDADSGVPLMCTSASAIVLTIENDATVSWDVFSAIAAYQAGAGAVSFAAGSGVTLRGTAPTAAQYTTQGVMRVGANEWAYL